MTPSDDDLQRLADDACRAAREAGALIIGSRPARVESKPGGDSPASRIVTDVDTRAEARILEILGPSAARLEHAVLTEERPDDRRRLEASHFWSIDPLDGTLPFVEGTPGYAVSIALVSRAGVPRLGVVFDPVSEVLHRAVAGRGHRREPPADAPPVPGDRLSVFVDRRLDASADSGRIRDALEAVASDRGLAGTDVRVGAGAVMNACYALEAPPACYIKPPRSAPGGGSLWDFAATACLFREAGAIATDFHGAPLDLNRPDSTFMNHRGVLYATDATLASQIRAACGRA